MKYLVVLLAIYVVQDILKINFVFCYEEIMEKFTKAVSTYLRVIDVVGALDGWYKFHCNHMHQGLLDSMPTESGISILEVLMTNHTTFIYVYLSPNVDNVFNSIITQ